MSKVRASEHPALALLYAARWQQLPAEDLREVTAHRNQCARCGRVSAATSLFPSGWIHAAYARLATVLDAVFVMPAAVGLHATGRAEDAYEVFETAHWTLTIERRSDDLRVVVNRRADGARHDRVQVAVIGPDRPVELSVPLFQVGEWWTGSCQIANPWSASVDPVEISVVVAEV
jgi:hypothetical protein